MGSGVRCYTVPCLCFRDTVFVFGDTIPFLVFLRHHTFWDTVPCLCFRDTVPNCVSETPYFVFQRHCILFVFHRHCTLYFRDTVLCLYFIGMETLYNVCVQRHCTVFVFRDTIPFCVCTSETLYLINVLCFGDTISCLCFRNTVPCLCLKCTLFVFRDLDVWRTMGELSGTEPSLVCVSETFMCGRRWKTIQCCGVFCELSVEVSIAFSLLGTVLIISKHIKSSKECLLSMTVHNVQIFGVSPFFKWQNS